MHTVIREEAPQIRNVKVGDILKIQEENEDGSKKAVSYRVTDVYHYMVRALSMNRNIPRCFSYGDLAMMGLEWQGVASEIIPEKARHDGPKKG